jgi:biotin carboxyl carrier protein
MRYEIEVAGRTRQVTVARSTTSTSGRGFAVTVDGHTWQVDAARIDGQTLSLLVDTVWRKSHEVVIVANPATAHLDVHVGATTIAVGLNGRRRRRKDEGAASGSGPQRLVAPMPGKVVRVLVKPGEAVRARQPLVVVEAMKMENELRAGRDGTVADIHAREGASVDAGALLIVIQ